MKKTKVKKGKVAVINKNGKLHLVKEAKEKDLLIEGDELIWGVIEKDKSKLSKEEKEKLR